MQIAKYLSFGFLSLLLLSACGGGGNNNDPVCGNGLVEEGEECDSTADCAADCTFLPQGPECGNGIVEKGEECDSTKDCQKDCTLRPPPPECPLLNEFNKLCVPLANNSNAKVLELGPNENCPAGFFPEQSQNGEAFNIRKLFDDTILIKETNNATGEIPVMVLFLGTKKALLYDTGHVTNALVDVVTPLLEGKPLEVINTHLHGDHINTNGDFNVIATDTDVDNIRNHCGIDDNDFDANQAAVCNNAANYTPPGNQTLFNSKSFRVVRVVRDRHKIDLGGRQITVLFTPGHSKTSTTLHDPTHRLLLTGDTLYPDDELPLVHPSGANGVEYLETAQRYAALEPEIDIVIGAHSQGVMPNRVLSAFLQLVQDNENGGNQNRIIDVKGCPSGNVTMGNFP